MVFNRCPNATFPCPRQCPGTPLMVKNQSRQITSKSVPLERARKTKHFSYKNLCLEMSRSKDMSTLIWSGDPTLWFWKLPKTTRIWYNNDNIFKTNYHKHTEFGGEMQSSMGVMYDQPNLLVLEYFPRSMTSHCSAPPEPNLTPKAQVLITSQKVEIENSLGNSLKISFRIIFENLLLWRQWAPPRPNLAPIRGQGW